MNTEAHFAPLLDLLVKSAALILIGTALLTALRKTSAANRHAVSVAIFAALLLLPLTKLMPARWSFVLEKPAAPAVNVRLPLIATVKDGGHHATGQPVEVFAQPAPHAPLVIPWKKLAVAVWLTGAALLLARRALIALRLRAVVRGSFPIEDERLATTVRALVTASGVRAEVRESDLCAVPLVSGVMRPVVLLPTEAADWSDAYVSSALRHELGHIRRRDCITRLLADVLCAFYWVNPLVWFAAREMRLAQEQACDDLVLNAGTPAGEYAEQLVNVVRSLQGDAFTARHALAMAQPSTLETRVLAIVDAQRDRSARSVRGTFAGITFIAASLALCTAAQLRGADEKKSVPAEAVQPGPQGGSDAMFLREWKVPPGLFQPGNAGDSGKTAVRDSLEKKGITFGADATAAFNPERSSILVRNTQAQLERIERFIADKAESADTPAAPVNSVAPAGDAKPEEALVFPKIEFRDASVRECVDFLVAKSKGIDPKGTGVNILLKDADKIGDVRITLSLTNVPLAEVLRYVAALANCELVREKFAFVIAPVQAGKVPVPNADQEKAALPAPAAPVPAEPKSAALKKAGAIIFPKIDLHDATLSETVEFLRAKSKDLDPDKQGVNLILMPLPGGADPKLTLSLTNIPLSEALRYVAALAGFEIGADEHAITVRRESSLCP